MNDDEIKSCLHTVAGSVGLKIKSLSRRPLTSVWQVDFVDKDRQVRFTPSPDATVEQCAKQFRVLLGFEDPSEPEYVEHNIDDLQRFRDPDDVLSAMDRLRAGGERAVERLVQVLLNQNEPSYFRSRAANTLAMIGDSRAIEPLIEILNESNVELRWSAVKALEDIGDERAIPPLERLATTESGHFSVGTWVQINVSEAALKALNKIRERFEAAI